MYWYEDILADFEGKVNELAEFTGFKVSEKQMKVIIQKLNKTIILKKIFYLFVQFSRQS
jgi:benzoyl-CoA reductase/2-hydroxyglutaryl-CoA dehydratase subunit BcrC/BadD/HgdB